MRRDPFNARLAGVLPLGAALLVTGCGPLDEDTETFTGELLSGATDVSAAVVGSGGDGESETAAVTAGGTEYIAYNANDPIKKRYADDGNSYTACDGAIDIGYSTSTGGSWTRQSLTMPANQAFLWGDPALTSITSNGTTTVFLSSLSLTRNNYNAIPAASKNADGCVIVRKRDGSLTGLTRLGVTLFRGTAGGTFGTLWEPNDGTTADGGSLLSMGGKMYFAYYRWASSAARMLTAGTTGSATVVADPPVTALGHPVLTNGWLPDGSQAVTMVVPTDGTNLSLTSYDPATNTWTTPITVATDLMFEDITMKSTGKVIRNGRGFTVMTDNRALSPAVLVFYQRRSGDFSQLQGVRCTLNNNSPSCAAVSNWKTSATSNAFMPVLSTSVMTSSSGGHPTSFRTYLSYWTDSGRTDGKVAMRFSLASSDGLTPAATSTAQDPCPDQRGYWGDYDGKLSRSSGFFDTWSTIARPITDSTGASCDSKWFIARPNHVSLLTFTPS